MLFKNKNTRDFFYNFQIGDIIDARDMESGAWFEAEIKKISKSHIGLTESRSTTPEKMDFEQNDTKTDENGNPEKKDVASPSGSQDKSPKNAFQLPDFYNKDDSFLYHVVYEG